MAKLNSIVRFLNKELRIKKVKDASRNGLQVKAKTEINRVGFAVDPSLSTFEKAKVDLLIVHHGIKWKPQKYKELTRKRIEYLKKNNISLYACHLPLDCHYKYGNNIELCRLLGLRDTKKFGGYHGAKIGYEGVFSRPVKIGRIAQLLNKGIKTKCDVYPFGKKQIRSVGIVSGGGSDAIEDAVKEKLDCFLVGEINQGAYNRAKDYGLNMIVAGHYATEITGVKALMPLMKERFKVQTVFIDNPTGV
jgi:dinuclear metal center YbgI/SA1388 family protein